MTTTATKPKKEKKEPSLKIQVNRLAKKLKDSNFDVVMVDRTEGYKTPDVTLGLYRTHKDVALPRFATEQSACFDLSAQYAGKTTYKGYNANNVEFVRNFANDSIKIMPGDRMMIPTGLIFDIPQGYSVRIHARSGLSLKQGLVLVNGEAVIDSDFVDETSVLLLNTSNNPIIIRNGDRIAQAELVPLPTYTFNILNTPPEVKTSRVGGLGSTGITTQEAPEEKKEEDGVQSPQA